MLRVSPSLLARFAGLSTAQQDWPSGAIAKSEAFFLLLLQAIANLIDYHYTTNLPRLRGEVMSETTTRISGAHLYKVFQAGNLGKIVNYTIEALQPHKDNFDTIAVRGVSGILVGSAVAIALNKHLIVVRKEGDDSHSGVTCEGHLTARRYVIVDDFVSSGKTVNTITTEIAQWQNLHRNTLNEIYPNAICYGGAMYFQYTDAETSRERWFRNAVGDSNAICVSCLPLINDLE
jgi:hypothetical protein